MQRLKQIVVGLATFVFFFVLFTGPLEMDEKSAFYGALAATVLAVFLWGRLSKKAGL
jgi:hypothetical protein